MRTVLIQKITVNPADGECALDLLMIDKYLERIGDHATNIAEWVLFSVTGKKGTLGSLEWIALIAVVPYGKITLFRA